MFTFTLLLALCSAPDYRIHTHIKIYIYIHLTLVIYMCSKWEQKLFVANSHISSWRTSGKISLSNASSFGFPRQYIYFRCAKTRMRERRFDATAHTYTHKEARVIAPKDARRQSDRRLQFVPRDPLSPRCLDFIFKFYLYTRVCIHIYDIFLEGWRVKT